MIWDITLCLVVDVEVPPKFKVPYFKKYNRVNYPKNYLIMYCRKMATHGQDDKLSIHPFQDSIAGTTLSSYMCLNKDQIHSWKDLVESFLK